MDQRGSAGVDICTDRDQLAKVIIDVLHETTDFVGIQNNTNIYDDLLDSGDSNSQLMLIPVRDELKAVGCLEPGTSIYGKFFKTRYKTCRIDA